MGNLVQGEHPQNSGGIVVGAVFSRKPAMTARYNQSYTIDDNRKSHTRFRLVPKSTTLDDLERPLRTVFQNTSFLSHGNLNEDRRTLGEVKFH